MSPDEVLDIARQGAALGCKEALFTLGDKPEDRWPEAREWLDAHGYDDTLAYVRAMSIRILEETGLLPHLNPGVLSWTDFQRLKPVAPSMGMMLETTATRLWSRAAAARTTAPRTRNPPYGCGSWRTRAAPRSPSPRASSSASARRTRSAPSRCSRCARSPAPYHGIQELIMQNFRAKPDTAMRGMPDAELDELVATVAVARHILGPAARIQAPPNLVGRASTSG